MIGMAEARREALGPERYNFRAAAVLDHIADLQERHRTAVVGIVLGEGVRRKVTVEEGIHAVADLGYEEELRMVAEEEDTLVGDMGCVEERHMVAVAVVGSPGCTGPAVHILPAEVDSLAADSFEEGVDHVEAADILLSNGE